MSRDLIAAIGLLIVTAGAGAAQSSNTSPAERCSPWPSCQFVEAPSAPPGQGGGGVSGTSRPPLPGNLGTIRDYRSFTGQP